MAKRRRLAPPEAGAAPEAPLPRAPSLPPVAQVAGEAAGRAAFDEVAGAMAAARAEGRLLQALPLERVVADHLIRDRVRVEDEAMAALRASLRARGQQTPIEVTPLPPDAEGARWGLISGWRRLMALRALAAEGGEATVLARIRAQADAPEAYVAMVEENEIRADLSYFERARIVIRATETGAFPDRDAALRALFANVSRAKRSKIRAFTRIIDALEPVLLFPTEIGERLGLKLAQSLAEDPGLAPRIDAAFAADPPDSAVTEQARLAALMAPSKATPAPPPAREVAGLRLVRDGQRITLSGRGVDEALLDDLAAWLAARR